MTPHSRIMMASVVVRSKERKRMSKVETTFVHLQAQSFQHEHAHKIPRLVGMRSDSDGSLSTGNNYEKRPKLVRFNTACSFKDGQCLFREIKMHWRTRITHEGVGDKPIVSESQRNSDKHTITPAPGVSNELWRNWSRRDFPIVWMSHVHVIFREVIRVQQQIGLSRTVMINY
jgi:hypothetical protein